MSKKILVVDDSVETVALIEGWLTSSGYKVRTASNGLEALKEVKTEKPDLIIVDILMPELDGFGLYKELKKDKDLAQIPFVVLTVRVKMEDTFRVLGVADFIVKPIEPQSFTRRIDQFFSGDASGSSHGAAAAAGTKKQFKVLVGGTVAIATQIKNLLPQNCVVGLCEYSAEILSITQVFKPDVILLDVLINNKPSYPIIIQLKKTPAFKNVPIVIYSNLDKANLKDVSISQRAVEIKAAQKACLEAGATESVGGFEETAFLKTIEKYF